MVLIEFFKINEGPCGQVYMGCYAYSSKRDLNALGLNTENTNGGGSKESCLNFCNQKGYIFAGVQYG